MNHIRIPDWQSKRRRFVSRGARVCILKFKMKQNCSLIILILIVFLIKVDLFSVVIHVANLYSIALLILLFLTLKIFKHIKFIYYFLFTIIFLVFHDEILRNIETLEFELNKYKYVKIVDEIRDDNNYKFNKTYYYSNNVYYIYDNENSLTIYFVKKEKRTSEDIIHISLVYEENEDNRRMINNYINLESGINTMIEDKWYILEYKNNLYFEINSSVPKNWK